MNEYWTVHWMWPAVLDVLYIWEAHIIYKRPGENIKKQLLADSKGEKKYCSIYLDR